MLKKCITDLAWRLDEIRHLSILSYIYIYIYITVIAGKTLKYNVRYLIHFCIRILYWIYYRSLAYAWWSMFSQVPMVSDMIITHHDNAMKDRLSGKSHVVSMQMAPHMNAEQCNNLEGEMQQLNERTGQHRNQAKNISKEVCVCESMQMYSSYIRVIHQPCSLQFFLL